MRTSLLSVLALTAVACAPRPPVHVPTATAPVFEFRLAYADSAAGRTPFTMEGKTLYLDPEAVVDDDDFARVAAEQQPTEVLIEFRIGGAGAERIAEATLNNPGRYMALLHDGRVLMAPMINGAVSGESIVAGVQLPVAEMEELVTWVQQRWPL